MTGETMMKSFFKENGGTYSVITGYRIPNLTLPDDGLGEKSISACGECGGWFI
jgi:hypothetical protein